MSIVNKTQMQESLSVQQKTTPLLGGKIVSTESAPDGGKSEMLKKDFEA